MGNGIVTLYAHGSEILVNTNDIVIQRQAVLKVGSTGYSTGPHAHFEVRINGCFANPEDYFE
ncbi:MAG: M23 family metallopeptidase [Clostridia bacterium]|nr:M23 family metallopeptidase [Clostridia bacterium]